LEEGTDKRKSCDFFGYIQFLFQHSIAHIIQMYMLEKNLHIQSIYLKHEFK
jgi:hypothetical protein